MGIRVRLNLAVRTEDGWLLFLERDVELPIAPAVGMVLYNLQSTGEDPSEDVIEQVSVDMKDGSIGAVLAGDKIYGPREPGWKPDPEGDWTREKLLGPGGYYSGWRPESALRWDPARGWLDEADGD
jgi:hypothetical protein